MKLMMKETNFLVLGDDEPTNIKNLWQFFAYKGKISFYFIYFEFESCEMWNKNYWRWILQNYPFLNKWSIF